MTIIEKLLDLHKQATTERSHYYVASVVVEAIAEIERLRHRCKELEKWASEHGLFILDKKEFWGDGG